jgi:hypothetical protein
MPIAAVIREVFGYFQNLNLLALIQDLRSGRLAKSAWSTGAFLCPVAHGLPAGEQVREVNVLGQADDLEDGCDHAACCLGAPPAAVRRFVRCWDEDVFSPGWLLQQLEELWRERLVDALAVQALLQGSTGGKPGRRRSKR